MDTMTKLGRARRLANIALFTIQLQCRRIKTKEPEDDEFIMRWVADLQFLIIALFRLRKIMDITCNTQISFIDNKMKDAINKYDIAIPYLKKFRDTLEHIDEYAVGSNSRHHKDICRKQIEVGSWENPTYYWLNGELNIDTSFIAAQELFKALKETIKKYQAILD